MENQNEPAPGAPAGEVSATAAALVDQSMQAIQPEAIDEEEYISMIAEVCHEVVRAYSKGIGDDSSLPWDQSAPEQRESVRQGVIVHLQSFLTPEQAHAAWRAQKERDGWKFGIHMDKKEHPNMVAYADLPEEQRIKDRLFMAVVRTLSKDNG